SAPPVLGTTKKGPSDPLIAEAPVPRPGAADGARPMADSTRAGGGRTSGQRERDAAVDEQDLAGEVGSLLARQEEERVCDVVRLPVTAHRHARCELADTLGPERVHG